MKRSIVIACLFGLLTTLFIAAGLGISRTQGSGLNYYGRARDPAAGEGTGVLLATRFGFGFYDGVRLFETVARDSNPGDMWGKEADHELVPAWAAESALPWVAGTAPWPGPGQQDRRAARATGWPFIALWHGYLWRNDSALPASGEYLTPGGIRVEPSTGNPSVRSVDYPRAIPLRPVWSGLVLDWLIYAVAWFGVLVIPRAFLARLRSLPGHCPNCGYDLTGLPDGAYCPECGGTG